MELLKNNSIRWGVSLVFVMAMPFLVGFAGSAPTWGGSMGMEDDWSVVNNPATPMMAEEVIQPEQQWRIGGDEEDMLFGLIEDALVDDEGNIYLLDTVLNTVYVLNSDGEMLHNLGGEGDGPGEFRFAKEMVFLPEGTLGIMEMMPGKVVVVDFEGNPHPSFGLSDGGQGMMNHMQHIDTNEDCVVIGKVVTTFGEGSATTVYTLASHKGDGSELATILENKEEQSGGNINLSFGGDNDFTSNFALCQDGRVVVYRNANEYKLEVLDVHGAKKHIIRRDYETVRRSDEDIADSKRQAEQMRERFGGSVELEIQEFAADISNVISRPNGDIWVANSQGDRDCPEQSIGFFDVFDKDGKYSKRVRIEADYDPERDRFAFTDDMLFVFKEAQKAPDRSSTMGGGGGGMMIMMVSGGGADDEDEDEDEEIRPYEVICYKLPR